MTKIDNKPCFEFRSLGQFDKSNWLGVKIILLFIFHSIEFLASDNFRRKLFCSGKPFGFSKVGYWDLFGYWSLEFGILL